MPATTATVVDWAAAGAAAAALAPPGPAHDQGRDRRPRRRAARVRGARRGPGGRDRRARGRRGRGRGPRRRPGRLGPGERRAASATSWTRSSPRRWRSRSRSGPPRARAPPTARPASPPITRAVNAAETGSLLAFMATKVLGQYDVLAPDGGRLLLVAPNVAHVESEIGAVPVGLPALGLPARGDPPGAVRGQPVAGRVVPRPGRRAARRHARRPREHPAAPRRGPRPAAGHPPGARADRRRARRLGEQRASSTSCRRPSRRSASTPSPR